LFPERIDIERIGPNGSRLILKDFDPEKDGGVYRCFAKRIVSDPTNCLLPKCLDSVEKFESIFVEAEVKGFKTDGGIWSNNDVDK
jgi:hypothetical protein